MKNQKLFGMMLATAVAVTMAGCKSPAMTQTPSGGTNATQPTTGGQMGTQTGTQTGSGAQLAPAKQQAATQNSQATADALNDEQDMNAYDAMANEAEAAPAKFSVMVVGAPKPAEGMVGITASAGAEAKADKPAVAPVAKKGAERLQERLKEAEAKRKAALEKAAKMKELKQDIKKKLEERETKKKEQLKGRLDKMKDAREKLHAKAKGQAWVDAGDGTEKKTFSFDAEKTVNGKTMGRSVEMVRIRNKDTKQLISHSVKFTQQLGNGLTRTSTRDKVLQEDGSYLVTFHSELTLPNGTKRVADWTKTIAADGGVTGTGTITWTGKDGELAKTVTINLGGKEEAEVAKTEDTTVGTTTEVTVTAEGNTTAAAGETGAAATATVAVTADPEAGSVAATTEATTTTTTTPTDAGAAAGTVETGTTATGNVAAQ